ncbi:MAG: DUF2752 domain-containing protein [Actinobacteria bacterium]|nr:DUF2752 domain-containing protein [Actinomycetota bacterium]
MNAEAQTQAGPGGGPQPSRAWERASALLFLAVAAGAVVAVLVPAVSRLVPPCAFRTLTGLYCPGCGTKRAMTALVHGDLITALRDNAFAVIVIVPVFVGLVLNVLDAFGLPRPWTRVRVDHRLVTAFGIAVLAFWILRNLPFVPFTYLSPP